MTPKFTESFRKILDGKLKENKYLLGEYSMNTLHQALDGYYQFILNSITRQDPYSIDKEYCIQLLKDNIEYINPSLSLCLGMGDKFYENEVLINMLDNCLPWDPVKWRQNGKIEEAHLYKCLSEYWENQQNVFNYLLTSKFSCFIDATFPNDKLERIKNSAYWYNMEGWLKYFRDLISLYFPEYQEKFSSKSIKRFVKPLNEEIYFGFEYNESAIKKETKIDIRICLPDYLNLFIANKYFSPKLKQFQYKIEYQDNILSLGILGNPFFYKPTYSLSTFGIIEEDSVRGWNIDEPDDNSEPKYKREFILGENEFQLVHPADFGERLKEYAFYHMDCLRFSSEGYLKYLEQCILEAYGEVYGS